MPRKQKKYHFIYKTTCIINNRFYIGIHSTNDLNDGYIGSGKLLRYSIKKYKKENHIFEILEFKENRSLLEDTENKMIESCINDPMCMNLTNGGTGFKGNHTEESKKKISEGLKNKTYEEIYGKDKANEQRQKRANGQRKYYSSLTEILKIERCKKISIKVKKFFKYNKQIQKEHQCNYCHKIGHGNAMFRWHFENCKLKNLKL
jgi:hypothetical protein